MSMNLFLVIQGLGGASANPRYPGAIDVDSFTLGSRQKSVALSQGLNDYIEMTPSLADMTITKLRDASSDQIWAAATAARVFPSAALIAEAASRRSVMTMIMRLVGITSVQTDGGSSNKETLTLSFQSIQISQTAGAPA
jgi:type VI protein secretion system component Hcp